MYPTTNFPNTRTVFTLHIQPKYPRPWPLSHHSTLTLSIREVKRKRESPVYKKNGTEKRLEDEEKLLVQRDKSLYWSGEDWPVSEGSWWEGLISKTQRIKFDEKFPALLTVHSCKGTPTYKIHFNPCTQRIVTSTEFMSRLSSHTLSFHGICTD